ncbi:MAG: restriction endonuclease subunit S, partial [Candidatus Roizmanbacteria bacterium]|nr:restriction endonuclease subunit S [Candidatus Roizmanbacteria bacterium]
EELELKNFKFKDDLFFIINSLNAKDRIDADYFQPKYEQLTEKLKLFKVNKLEDYISNYSTGFTFKSDNYLDEGIPLIRINNIKKGLIDLSDTAYLSEKDFLLSPKDEAKAGNIVLSMSGSIGSAAIIPSEIPKCSVNQRILKFTSKNINKEYLVLVLNSIVGNLQLERIGTGGVQTNIGYNDTKNILIPELETNIQQRIADLVRKSHEARKKSKELLNETKRKVEEMIEKESM